MQRIINSNHNTDKNMSIYIHIPFCVSKCTYCDFCSFVCDTTEHNQYLMALHQEIDARASDFVGYHITSIYIGGGTPSVLPVGALSAIIQHIRSTFDLSKCTSITVEANPNSFTPQLASSLALAGVNRLSFGLQSSDNRLLKLLNRPHTYEDLERAIQVAISANITNINVDILLGIPTQTMEQLTNTLNNLVNLPIKHISAYGLILEPGTPLTRAIQNGELKELDEDFANVMYDYTVDFLQKNGYSRYEISNFAIPGFESLHNLNYWQRGQYLGLGLASHSFLNGFHWQNTDILSTYINNPTNCIQDVEQENIHTAKLETIMLALRTTKGLDITKFNAKFGTDFMQDYQSILNELLEQGLITIQDNILNITDYNLSNSIIAMFA